MATMPAIDSIPPRRLGDLTIQAVEDGSEYVVKNPDNRKYLKVGPVEAFLLERLDGQMTVDGIQRAFEAKFGEPLSAADLQEFLGLASSQGLIAARESDENVAAQGSGLVARIRSAWHQV